MNSLLKSILAKTGYTIRRAHENTNPRPKHIGSYIPCAPVVEASDALGMTAARYLYQHGWKNGKGWNNWDVFNPEMQKLDVWNRYRGKRVLEIGAGAGLFLESIKATIQPESYETYETDQDWSAYLAKTYGVTAHVADGSTLAQTADQSVDAVFCNGVFVYIPWKTTNRYWREIVRVLKPGGTVVFDVFTEDCLTDSEMDKWHADQANYLVPCAKSTVLDFFLPRGFTLKTSFRNVFGVGESRYFVLERSK